MIAEFGTFKGSLNDICDYLLLNKTSKNRAKIKSQLLQEEKDDLIVNKGLSENTKPSEAFELSIVPKDQHIELDKDWIDLNKLRNVSYSRSVSYEVLVKVLLWIIINNQERRKQGLDITFVGNNASSELGIDNSTFTDARKVLEDDFNIFNSRTIYSDYKIDGEDFKRPIGQMAEVGAFVNYPDNK